MISWKWRRTPASPEDILSGAQSLPTRSSRVIFDLTSDWITSERYLSWAKDCLNRENNFGWDAANAYSKRAACRQIDAFIVSNHLGKFLSLTYPAKIEMLSEIDVIVPDIIQELIINPRNEIEHGYKASTREQARHAVQLAGLFLGAVAEEAGRKAIISINWAVNMRGETRSTPSGEVEKREYSLTPRHPSMLLIDVSNAAHQVLILHPKDEEILIAPLYEFTRGQTLELAKLLRKHYALESTGYTTMKLEWLNKLKVDIDL